MLGLLGLLGLWFVRRPAPLDISKRSRADVGPGRFAPASRWRVKGGTHDIVPPDFAEILSSDVILRHGCPQPGHTSHDLI